VHAYVPARLLGDKAYDSAELRDANEKDIQFRPASALLGEAVSPTFLI
jgi:hypothetical protein